MRYATNAAQEPFRIKGDPCTICHIIVIHMRCTE